MLDLFAIRSQLDFQIIFSKIFISLLIFIEWVRQGELGIQKRELLYLEAMHLYLKIGLAEKRICVK